VKYNSAGVQQWAARYNGPASGHDGASLVVTDPSGNIFVTGESTGNDTARDYATINGMQMKCPAEFIFIN